MGRGGGGGRVARSVAALLGGGSVLSYRNGQTVFDNYGASLSDAQAHRVQQAFASSSIIQQPGAYQISVRGRTTARRIKRILGG